MIGGGSGRACKDQRGDQSFVDTWRLFGAASDAIHVPHSSNLSITYDMLWHTHLRSVLALVFLQPNN